MQKRITNKALYIAILCILFIASLVMGFTGAWFSSTDGASDGGMTFGTITLADTNAQFTYHLGEESLDVLMPGDEIDVSFTVDNAGTADMWVRFSLITSGNGEQYFQTPVSGLAPTGYTYSSGYFYRSAPMIGDLDQIANEDENITMTFVIPNTTGDEAEGANVSFTLNVDAVQTANNGSSAMTAEGWPESAIQSYFFMYDGNEVGNIVGEEITEENLPEMTVAGNPAYYGLYADAGFTQEIELPYSGASTVYPKFGTLDEDLFYVNLINNNTEYTIGQMGYPIGVPPALGDVVIPERYDWKPITMIDDYAFSGSNGLTSIDIPATVNVIGDDAFSSCEDLTSITIPDSVTSIGAYAFSFSGLTSIAMPDSITFISEYMFEEAADLITVIIPESVTSIDDYAFYNATSLSNVYVERLSSSGITTAGANMFSGCTNLAHIYVSDEDSVSAYQNASIWSLYADKIEYNEGELQYEYINSYQVIGMGTFKGTDIVIAETYDDGVHGVGPVVYIKANALANKGITSVAMPATMQQIYSGALKNNNIHTIKMLSETPPNLAPDALEGNSNITNILVPEAKVNTYKSAWSSFESVFEPMPATTAPTITTAQTTYGIEFNFTNNDASAVTITYWITNTSTATQIGDANTLDLLAGATSEWIEFGSTSMTYTVYATAMADSKTISTTQSKDQDSGACVEESTLILMADGTHKQAKDVEVGDSVWVWVVQEDFDGDYDRTYEDAEGHYEVQEVTSVENYWRSQYVQINNDIKVAINHQIFVFRDNIWQWVSAAHLTLEDYVYIYGEGKQRVTSVNVVTTPTSVISIIVDERGALFAGESNIFNHNGGGGGGSIIKPAAP
jgi:hypothetical protein